MDKVSSHRDLVVWQKVGLGSSSPRSQQCKSVATCPSGSADFGSVRFSRDALGSTLGLHHYRVRSFERVESWVTLCLAAFLYLEKIRAEKLGRTKLTKPEKGWWQAQRSHGLILVVRQSAERRELGLLGETLRTPTGLRRMQKLLARAHPKEYRAAI